MTNPTDRQAASDSDLRSAEKVGREYCKNEYLKNPDWEPDFAQGCEVGYLAGLAAERAKGKENIELGQGYRRMFHEQRKLVGELKHELEAEREKHAEVVSALEACSPAWLPPAVRDQRRAALPKLRDK